LPAEPDDPSEPPVKVWMTRKAQEPLDLA